MEISEDTQSVSDLIWFAIDVNGFVCSFSSGGGRIPPSVAQSEETYLKTLNYFKELEVVSPDYTLSERIKKEAMDAENRGFPLILRDDIKFLKRGITIFDKSDLSHLGDPYYYRLGIPDFRLHSSMLSHEMRNIVCNTILNNDSKIDEIVDAYVIQ